MLKDKTMHARTVFGSLALAAALFSVALLAAPVPALADGEPVAHSVDSSGNITNYATVDEAVAAGCADAHPTIVMDADWTVNNLTIGEGKQLTIDMQAKTIKNSGNSDTITLKSYSKLTLMSSRAYMITYTGYDPENGAEKEQNIISGGLVTNQSADRHSGILVGSYAELTLAGVTVGGCNGTHPDRSADNGGGVTMEWDSTLNMKNGAKIEHNKSGRHGAGVYVRDKYATINMEAYSSICNNYAAEHGGGVYSTETKTTINMNSNASISENRAGAGGGVYFDSTYFKITSTDSTPTASISKNTSFESGKTTSKRDQSGGGIHVDQKSGKNDGLIENVIISGNHSEYDAGGIELDQEDTTVRNCTITENTCKYEGGGIYDCNDDNVIDGSTITKNTCNLAENGYEGGGIFVWHSYDIKMTGVCLVKDNYRGKKKPLADDVMLRENAGATAKAYITGGVKKGSKIGVRTGVTGDRMIGKSINNETEDSFFIDIDGYYVSYGSDHDGDMWQRHASKEFELKVNGNVVGRHTANTQVTVNGASSDTTKVFKCWTADGTSGLDPFSDYIPASSLKSPTLKLKMPQNDVDLKATYVTRTSDVTLSVDAPTPLKALPKKGTISWKTASGETKSKEVAVTWQMKYAQGYIAATGNAKFTTDYLVSTSVAQDLDADLAFALKLAKDDVAVKIGGKDVGTQSVNVDASGTLALEGGPYTSDNPTVTKVYGLSMTVADKTTEAVFLNLIPTKVRAKTNAGTTVTVNVGTGRADQDDYNTLIQDGKVARPESGKMTMHFPIGSKSVIIPDNLKTIGVEITVTEEEAETVETPTVEPAEGDYSTVNDSDRFVDDQLKVTATCATEETNMRYVLYTFDEDNYRWDQLVSGAAWPADGLLLKKNPGGQVSYKIEIRANKYVTGGQIYSQTRTVEYVIDDTQPIVTHKVTVAYADTAAEGHHGSKDSDVIDVEDGKDATLTAPHRDGYVFEKWQDENGRDLGCDPTLTLSQVVADTTVNAIYNPTVSELNVTDMDEPMAHGKLAKTARIWATAGDSSKSVEVTPYFVSGTDGAKITWAPEGDQDGKATHMTNYTATLSLSSAAIESGAKYYFPQSIKVTYKGNDVGAAAYYVDGDDPRLCIEFPNTGPYEEPSLAQLGDINLGFDRALKAYEGQDAEHPTWAWDLPDQVEVTYKCGETEMYDISWTSISDFDKTATDEQTLTAKGTVTWPDYVDTNDNLGEGGLVSNKVTVKINVAAPNTVATPSASLVSGTYKGAQSITLSCDIDDATIRYTTDGSDPDENSAEYDGETLKIAHSCTLKLKAFLKDWTSSKVATREYTIQHEVTFETGDGSKVESQWVDDGELAKKPANPTLQDFTFEGWALEDGTTYTFTEKVTEDVKLYAQWSAKGDGSIAHTVTFDSAGGSAVKTKTVRHGACVKEPSAPTRDGYVFLGWKLDGADYDFSTPVNGNLKLVAAWKKKDDGKSDDDKKDDDKKDDDKKDDADNHGGSGTDDSDKGGSSSDNKGDAGSKNETATVTATETVTKTETKTANALAATGDRTLLIVAPLVALGVLAAAAGIVSKRKKK